MKHSKIYLHLPFYIFRLLKAILFSFGKVKVRSPLQLIGKDCTLDVENGCIILGSRCKLADRVSLIACGKGCISLGSKTFINENSRLVAMDKIDIGEDCLIADSVSMYDHDHEYSDRTKPFWKQGYLTAPITVGRNVWIGSHVVVCKGVTIGENSIIGAGSVVTKSIPDNVIAVGVPAKVIKSR